MRRRLLGLCLLAYPRVRRERDREYLRDLALELSETYGLRRQAVSLVRGGLGERIGGGAAVWARWLAAGCVGVAAVGFAASGVIGSAADDVGRVETGRLVCVDSPGACAEPTRLVAARERGGWDCAVRRHAQDDRRAVAWRCTI